MLAFILLVTNNVFADTIWQGDISSDWDTPGNWSAGVPDASDIVFIQGVALPNVNPIIAGAAVAKAVSLSPGGFLTIAVGGTLSVANSLTHGIFMSGSIENNGTLNIDDVAYNAIGLASGSLFTNKGTINIGNTADIGYSGIYNEAGTFVNESGAIFINRTGKASSTVGAIVVSGTFTNKANITIGGVVPGLYDGKGIWCAISGNFLNEAGALISISRTVSDGIYNVSGFTNNGSIDIGAAGDIGGYGILNHNNSSFTNQGAIAIGTGGNIGGDGIANLSGAYYTNQGSIDIGTGGDIGGDGIFNDGYFDNTASTAYINIASDNVISNNDNYGEFYNGGVVIENATGYSSISENTGVIQNLNGGSFAVLSGYAAISASGQIWTGFSDAEWNNSSNWHNALVPTASDDVTIADMTTDPIISTIEAKAKSVTVQNGASLTIGGSGTLTIDGADVQGLLNQGTVVNNGLLKIGLTTGTGSYGVRNEGQFANSSGGVKIDNATQAAFYNFSGTFTNNASLSLKTVVAAPFLLKSDGGTISNNASGTLSGTGIINPAHFTNNGMLSPGYSPGILTFDGSENFATSTLAIEVNAAGVAGIDFDQIVVNGTATLGGTLALTFNFPAPSDGDVVTIIDATALASTFSSVTGLPEHWTVKYDSPNTGEVSLEYSNNLPVTLVHFAAKKLNDGVKLDWQTSEETNNQGFDIERLLYQGTWESIGFVEGHGSTKGNSTYSFWDGNPLAGVNYYRLRQLDFDGKVEYSRIVSVSMDEAAVVKIYPNPTSGIIHVEGSRSEVKILDILGRSVMDGTITNQKIDVSHLPDGFYILAVFSESKVQSIPVVKLSSR
ncbi:MAG: T9SS type A sorting domain-containing protein [Dyadobacter sp.]|uniref:T9SS type A sorting domain-containing protein n=1 Tax=Dyadobacter sp. TaxID=1914288 RepID=UPI001B08CF8A|nr:T9SS type A sorting domain-containing protein [Dyadobacter sp.]MBO9616422.1 T9SS type A sorting domain-containing protein [Dyadobacter sp.]